MQNQSRNASRLIVIASVNSLALASVGSLINPYLRDLGMSAAFVGLYFAVLAAVQGAAAFVGGFLADTFGRRRIWIAGKCLQLAGYALLAAGVRGSAMLLVAVLIGLAQVGQGARTALEADASDSRRRATFFAAVQTVSTLIGAVAPLAGGLIADRYGVGLAFAGILPLLAVVLILIAGLEERLSSSSEAQLGAVRDGRCAGKAGGRLTAVRQQLAVLSDGILRGPHPRTAKLLLAFWPLNGVANAFILVGLPLLLRDRFGLGYMGLGALQTALCIGSTATMLVVARLADRQGRRRIILMSVSGCALVYWFAPILTSPMQFYALVFIDGLVGNACVGAYSATAVECVTEPARATFSGVLGGLDYLGAALGSLAAGLAYTAGPTAPVLAGATIFSILALMAWLFLEETGRPQPVALEMNTAVAQDGA